MVDLTHPNLADLTNAFAQRVNYHILINLSYQKLPKSLGTSEIKLAAKICQKKKKKKKKIDTLNFLQSAIVTITIDLGANTDYKNFLPLQKRFSMNKVYE